MTLHLIYLLSVRFIRNSLLFLAFLAIVNFFLSYYDRNFGSDDGLIKEFFFSRIISIFGFVFVLFMLSVLGAKATNKTLQNISLSALSFLVCILIIELFAWVSLKSGVIKWDRPNHHLLHGATNLVPGERPFWGDFNPYFGKWYLPLDTLRRVNCQGDSLYSFTNSFGARDKERNPKSNNKRVVLLGDSFIEGYMVNTKDRLSDILEQTTGIEHLNFGINGTSPINYYLNYLHLASQFDHDSVIVGILPANDFEDFTQDQMVDLIENPLYRPYWKGEYPNYELRYSLSSVDQSVYSLAKWEEPQRISMVIDSVFKQLSGKDKLKAIVNDNSYTRQIIRWASDKIRKETTPGFTRFNHYTHEEWEIFSYSLERLIHSAQNKKVIFMLIPILNDIKSFQVHGENRLYGDLTKLFEPYPNVKIIDLLAEFNQYPDPERFFVACDGHWSVEGEKVVSEILLRNPTYRAVIEIENSRMLTHN